MLKGGDEIQGDHGRAHFYIKVVRTTSGTLPIANVRTGGTIIDTMTEARSTDLLPVRGTTRLRAELAPQLMITRMTSMRTTILDAKETIQETLDAQVG